ncbi:unnamed protein product [Auanema sp. JU1783]|nr:unnamed protein product [Auanema sp. JU1783]
MRFLAVCILATCIASCLSIDCIVCDSYLSCTTQTKEFCPDSLSCYTVFERHVAVAKGCASSCHRVPAANQHGRSCSVCDYDECNSDNSILVAGDEYLNKPYRRPFARIPRNLGGRNAQIELNEGIGSGAVVRSSKNHHIGSGAGVEESRSIGGGVSIDRHHDQSGPAIGGGVGLNNVGPDSQDAKVPSGSIGSGVSISKPGIGQGVQIKMRRSIGRGAVPEHHRDHHKKHHHPPPPPPSTRHIGSGVEVGHHIGSGVDVGHRIGSGVSGYQATKDHHKSKHHSYRTRRSELDQLVRGNEPDIYRPRQNHQGYDSIGGGVVPERHNHQDGSGIGHGVSPRKSSSTLTSLLYIPVSYLVRRFVF